jgi:hypothetical protein
MDTRPAVTPETTHAVCACAVPLPEVRATHKGAARTHCARCDLPVRLEFGAR